MSNIFIMTQQFAQPVMYGSTSYGRYPPTQSYYGFQHGPYQYAAPRATVVSGPTITGGEAAGARASGVDPEAGLHTPDAGTPSNTFAEVPGPVETF